MDGLLRAEQLARRRLSSMNSLWRSSWSLPDRNRRKSSDNLYQQKWGENEAETLQHHGSTWIYMGQRWQLARPFASIL